VRFTDKGYVRVYNSEQLSKKMDSEFSIHLFIDKFYEFIEANEHLNRESLIEAINKNLSPVNTHRDEYLSGLQSIYQTLSSSLNSDSQKRQFALSLLDGISYCATGLLNRVQLANLYALQPQCMNELLMRVRTEIVEQIANRHSRGAMDNMQVHNYNYFFKIASKKYAIDDLNAKDIYDSEDNAHFENLLAYYFNQDYRVIPAIERIETTLKSILSNMGYRGELINDSYTVAESEKFNAYIQLIFKNNKNYLKIDEETDYLTGLAWEEIIFDAYLYLMEHQIIELSPIEEKLCDIWFKPLLTIEQKISLMVDMICNLKNESNLRLGEHNFLFALMTPNIDKRMDIFHHFVLNFHQKCIFDIHTKPILRNLLPNLFVCLLELLKQEHDRNEEVLSNLVRHLLLLQKELIGLNFKNIYGFMQTPFYKSRPNPFHEIKNLSDESSNYLFIFFQDYFVNLRKSGLRTLSSSMDPNEKAKELAITHWISNVLLDLNLDELNANLAPHSVFDLVQLDPNMDSPILQYLFRFLNDDEKIQLLHQLQAKERFSINENFTNNVLILMNSLEHLPISQRVDIFTQNRQINFYLFLNNTGALPNFLRNSPLALCFECLSLSPELLSSRYELEMIYQILAHYGPHAIPESIIETFHFSEAMKIAFVQSDVDVFKQYLLNLPTVPNFHSEVSHQNRWGVSLFSTLLASQKDDFVDAMLEVFIKKLPPEDILRTLQETCHCFSRIISLNKDEKVIQQLQKISLFLIDNVFARCSPEELFRFFTANTETKLPMLLFILCYSNDFSLYEKIITLIDAYPPFFVANLLRFKDENQVSIFRHLCGWNEYIPPLLPCMQKISEDHLVEMFADLDTKNQHVLFNCIREKSSKFNNFFAVCDFLINKRIGVLRRLAPTLDELNSNQEHFLCYFAKHAKPSNKNEFLKLLKLLHFIFNQQFFEKCSIRNLDGKNWFHYLLQMPDLFNYFASKSSIPEEVWTSLILSESPLEFLYPVMAELSLSDVLIKHIFPIIMTLPMQERINLFMPQNQEGFNGLMNLLKSLNLNGGMHISWVTKLFMENLHECTPDEQNQILQLFTIENNQQESYLSQLYDMRGHYIKPFFEQLLPLAPIHCLREILLCRNHKNQNLIICKESESEIIFSYAYKIILERLNTDHAFMAKFNESIASQPHFLINIFKKDSGNIDLLMKHFVTLPIEMLESIFLQRDPITEGTVFSVQPAYRNATKLKRLLTFISSKEFRNKCSEEQYMNLVNFLFFTPDRYGKYPCIDLIRTRSASNERTERFDKLVSIISQCKNPDFKNQCFEKMIGQDEKGFYHLHSFVLHGEKCSKKEEPLLINWIRSASQQQIKEIMNSKNSSRNILFSLYHENKPIFNALCLKINEFDYPFILSCLTNRMNSHDTLSDKFYNDEPEDLESKQLYLNLVGRIIFEEGAEPCLQEFIIRRDLVGLGFYINFIEFAQAPSDNIQRVLALGEGVLSIFLSKNIRKAPFIFKMALKHDDSPESQKFLVSVIANIAFEEQKKLVRTLKGQGIFERLDIDILLEFIEKIDNQVMLNMFSVEDAAGAYIVPVPLVEGGYAVALPEPDIISGALRLFRHLQAQKDYDIEKVMNCRAIINLFSNPILMRPDSSFLQKAILAEPEFMFSMLSFLDTRLAPKMLDSYRSSFFKSQKNPSYDVYCWLEKNILKPLASDHSMHEQVLQNHPHIMSLLIRLMKRTHSMKYFQAFFYDQCSMLNVLDEQRLTEYFSLDELVEILNSSLNSMHSSHGLISLISRFSPGFIQAIINQFQIQLNLNPLMFVIGRAQSGFLSEAIVFLKMLNANYPQFIAGNPVVPDLLFLLVPQTNYVSSFLQHQYSLFPENALRWLYYRDTQACNLLMCAIKSPVMDMALIELLLGINQSYGLSLLDDRNIEGKTVMDLALDINNPELLNLIVQYSRKRTLEPNPQEPAYKK